MNEERTGAEKRAIFVHHPSGGRLAVLVNKPEGHDAAMDATMQSVDFDLRPTSAYGKDDRSYLYFIRSGEFLKVGIAKNVPQRFASLQTGNPQPMTLDATLEIPAALAGQIERHIHRALGPERHRGEWFLVETAFALILADPYIRRAWWTAGFKEPPTPRYVKDDPAIRRRWHIEDDGTTKVLEE